MAASGAKENVRGNNQQTKSGHHSRQYEGEHQTNPWMFSSMIGFFAGLVWGVIRWLFYELKFTTELPGLLVDPFFKSSYLKTGWGIVIGIASYIVFSILASLLYKVLLGKLKGPWPGVFYGLGWWAVIFLLLGPALGISRQITVAGWNTLFSELCIFLLWGLFIGYSIAFEFTDEASREPIGAH
ncbi:Conserved membrane protein YqhR [Paenibacillus catalpae]|uniref:Conserved membrane protein YqhR n=1 Tax=Paenibacillus catalpae TaxID=1045775 RepID=A0A1I2F8S2_9BACL|nr:YqhR family membrane protein [Paenibacillus catalpae]SFF01844.1 Conserved membrane protein YqhR [Paenibacillus catalpae]